MQNLEKLIAKDLLSIRAVFFRPEEPFTWASGIKSPVYCDNRLTPHRTRGAYPRRGGACRDRQEVLSRV